MADMAAACASVAASGAAAANEAAQADPTASSQLSTGIANTSPAELTAGIAASSSSCSVSRDIARLLEEQKRVREERKKVTNDLRNAQRRRSRLKHKARLLSSTDLMTVMALRT